MIEIQRIDEIEAELDNHHDAKLKLKLLFLRFLYRNFDDMEYACEAFKVGQTTAYEWIHRWNEGGVRSLHDQPISGRPSKLKEEEVNQLKEYLKGKNWDWRDVKELILDKFKVNLGKSSIYELLKDKMKMHNAKPYKKDYRRPQNAEEILASHLQEKFDILDSYGIEPKEVAIGFLDEASPQNKSNSSRVWSVEKPQMEVNTQKFKANTIGFYAIEGENVIDFLLDSKIGSIKEFFQEIRKANESYEYIIVILDNFKTHHASEVVKIAFDLGILLVFLPPYSPDLNPIEFIWKSVKRVLSKVFIKDETLLRGMILGAFTKFSQSLSFAWNWIQNFLPESYKNNILTNVN
ncbi:MAG TPA: IS630 family transposase [Parachlamydiaceae bacterium]|nr:IS630 family transposase [Nitrosopumilus sp.]HEV8051812.1 IS630 family transposase [Parachlamydiaceae bacterium]